MVSLFGSGNKKKEKKKKPGFLDRLKQAVASTKAQLVERIEEIVEKKAALDESVLDDLEATLITADLGVRTTQEILGRLKQQISQGKLRETSQLRPAVEQGILAILESSGAGSAAPKAKQPPPGMPARHLCGGGERRGQNHQHRQAGPLLLAAEPPPPALRRGYLPRRRQ